MKKLFLLVPAILLALTANAITPGTKALYNAYNAAQAGSTIVLEAGTYDETDRLIFTKDMTIMAAEGAEVIVKTHKDNQIKEGAKVKFIGIKFDGSEMGSYEYFIRSYDATDGKELRFEKCEMTGFAAQYLVNAAGAARTLDSVIINDCKCIGNSHDAIYIGAGSDTKETAKGIIVKNSTFANFSNLSHSVIEVDNYGSTKTPNIEVTVDHCTFYNNPTSASGYADIRVYKSTKVAISNCIFAHPEAYARCGTYCYGGTIDNCLSYNLTSGTKGHRADDINLSTCLPNADPLFTDAANGDFTLAGNYITGEVSPARGAATDGSDLGDPRWYTSGTYYTTDFADPGYNFTAAKAVTIGAGIEVNEHYGVNNPYLRYTGSTPTSAKATWLIEATRACYVDVTINMANNEWEGKPDGTYQNGKHIFGVEVWDENNVRLDTVAEGLYENGSSLDGYSTYPTIHLGSLYIPEPGVYTVKLLNCRSWSKCGVSSITMTYSGGDTIQMPGIATVNDAWFSPEGTRTDGKISFPGSTIQNGWVKWNVSFATASNYKAIVKASTTSGHNYTVKLYRNENDQDPITFANGANYDQTGDPVNIEIDPQLVEAGDYILEVVNSLTNSNAKLLGVQFVYAGGGIVDLPATLTPQDAVLEQGAYIDNDSINFALLEDAYAKWNVHSDGGYYTFKTNAFNAYALGQKYTISIYNSDETELIYSKQSVWNNTVGAFSFTTDAINLPENDYVVRIKNYDGSKGRVMNIEPEYAGGAIITIPNNNIPLADALLSTRAYRDNDGLHFTDADHYYCIADENATWNIQATAGVYTFTLNVAGTNYGIYELTVTDSQNNQVFKDSKGKSGTGTVSISSVLIPADGNYTIQLANINNHADGYLTSLAAAKEDVIVLDELAENNTMLVENQNTPKRIMLKRTFKGGMFNTICLPFSIGSNSTLEDIFGEGYELLQLVDATLEGSVLNLQFENVNTLSHGVPYLIKPAADVTNPTISNRTIKDLTVPEYTRGVVDFVGNFIKDEIPASENNLFLATNNALYFPTEALPIKGMRAYFKVNIPGAAHVLSHARIVTREQIVTDVELVSGQSNNTEKRIENGQLIIIKNGVRYNVMGTKIQ